jgi:hypothetical protein
LFVHVWHVSLLRNLDSVIISKISKFERSNVFFFFSSLLKD